MISQPPVELLHPIMTSTQSTIHDQLERKHDELQQIIHHQQDELRRVSQQLIIARYGLATNSTAPLASVVQPIVNHLSPNIVQAIAGGSPVHQIAEHHMQHQQTPPQQSYAMAPADHSISGDHHQASSNMHEYDDYSSYLQMASMTGVQPQHTQHHAQLLHPPQPQHNQQLSPGHSNGTSGAADRQTSATATHGDVMKILYHTR